MFFFFFNDTATTEIYTLSLHDALPIYEERWRALCALRGLERLVLRSIHPLGSRRVRSLLRSVRSNGPPGPNDHPNSTETGLLLPVALCLTLALASFHGDARASYRSGDRDRRSAASSISVRGRGKELAPAPHRCSKRPADRNNAGNVHASYRIHSLDSAH